MERDGREWCLLSEEWGASSGGAIPSPPSPPSSAIPKPTTAQSKGTGGGCALSEPFGSLSSEVTALGLHGMNGFP